MIRLGLLLVVVLLPAVAAQAQQPVPVRVVSAQPAVLDIVHQIGSTSVATVLLSPAVGSASGPSIIVTEGGIFDSWAKPFLAHLPKGATLLRARPNDDSAEGFSWYDLDATWRFAQAFADELTRRRPDEAVAISAALIRFQESLARLERSANLVANSYRDSAVLLTDSRFSPILRMLRLRVVPVDAGLPALERAIRTHKGVILIFDSETKAGMPENIRNEAEEDGLPLVGLRETMPSGLHYQQWIARAMNTIQGALNEAAP